LEILGLEEIRAFESIEGYFALQAAFVRLKAFRTADDSKEDTTTDGVILVIASEDLGVL
jgi:hypothetical protein